MIKKWSSRWDLNPGPTYSPPSTLTTSPLFSRWQMVFFIEPNQYWWTLRCFFSSWGEFTRKSLKNFTKEASGYSLSKWCLDRWLVFGGLPLSVLSPDLRPFPTRELTFEADKGFATYLKTWKMEPLTMFSNGFNVRLSCCKKQRVFVTK